MIRRSKEKISVRKPAPFDGVGEITVRSLLYILSGKGRYNDNGTIVEIGPGDVAYCAPGEGHGLACHGEEPVEMIALILYQ